MPKRKREESVNDERPPPPPPPPAALVRLLQSNKKVLEYFTLLQANLDYDKQKWKNRSSSLKRECEDLRKKVASIDSKVPKRHPIQKIVEKSSRYSYSSSIVEKTSNEGIHAIKKSEKLTLRESSSDDSHKNGSNLPCCEEEESEKGHPEGEPINDGAFNVSLDDSSYQSKHLSECSSDNSCMPHTCDKLQSSFYKRLNETQRNLRYLGVYLVEDEKKRRSDAVVVADLLYALRTVSRIQLMQGKKTSIPTAPFIDLVPACNYKEHPAFQAKESVYASLYLMEKLCIQMDLNEWEKLSVSTSSDEDCTLISVGMRNRQSLVRSFMQSLNAEISYCWPVFDRTSRALSTALHYEVQEEENYDEQPSTENFSTKSQARLSTIAERVLLTQLLSRYLSDNGKSLELFELFCRYIMAAMPSFHTEKYPKYPPVLSLCVVEALLVKDDVFLGNDIEYVDILRCTAIAIHAAAMIWRQRLQSRDNRITDISRVELASYSRILELGLIWVGEPLSSIKEIHSRCKVVSKDVGVFGMAVASIVTADRGNFSDIGNRGKASVEQYLGQACAYSAFTQQIEIRKINHYRKVIGVPDCIDDQFLSQSEFLYRLKAELEFIDFSSNLFWAFTSSFTKCCLFLSNGLHAAMIAKTFDDLPPEAVYNELSTLAYRSLMEVAQTPLVRVINLKRRVDRRNAFQAQAKIERLLVVHAVARITANLDEDDYFWGNFAFDGNAKNMDEIQDVKVVATHWRPSNLKAFDENAWDNGSPVKISRSERACSFSHVASWQGVRRSLELPAEEPNRPLTGSFHVQRLFRISGFARGEPLQKSNTNMPPSPVCLIMEDDAILVDRFTDRLEEVLAELPRDFHFCSLGYSRPKAAPIVPWSSQVGIPTCIWYLTGYLISLDGAKYLLEKLPVQGPIDSWIGLQMCANWENKYGQQIGVGIGKQPKRDVATPPKEELELIMKFQAFCALTPLCSQKVGTELGTGRSWRHRDTDIEYSGSVKGKD
mmetsp:Transcript_25582/g.37787  ORF Transcript_25582/g.37787 Transcript_25582/m.37787 type:complete len:998 (-) Transcript_25582:10-3003(-)